MVIIPISVYVVYVKTLTELVFRNRTVVGYPDFLPYFHRKTNFIARIINMSVLFFSYR